jgi:hypothetical protein
LASVEVASVEGEAKDFGAYHPTEEKRFVPGPSWVKIEVWSCDEVQAIDEAAVVGLPSLVVVVADSWHEVRMARHQIASPSLVEMPTGRWKG